MAPMQTDEEKNPDIAHDEVYSGVIAGNQKAVNAAGRQATIAEHDLTFKQAVKAYPRAIFWSALVSTCIIMEGYDVVLMGSMFAQPAFLKKYGNFYPNLNDYQLSAPWLTALGNSGNIGAILGYFANGYFVQILATDAFSWRRYSPSLPSFSLCSSRRISRRCSSGRSSLAFLGAYSHLWRLLMHPRSAPLPFVDTLQCTSTFARHSDSSSQPVSTKDSNP